MSSISSVANKISASLSRTRSDIGRWIAVVTSYSIALYVTLHRSDLRHEIPTLICRKIGCDFFVTGAERRRLADVPLAAGDGDDQLLGGVGLREPDDFDVDEACFFRQSH